VGLSVFLVIAVIIVLIVFAQRLNARRLLRDRNDPAAGGTGPSTSSFEGPRPVSNGDDEISSRIEDEIERMGITVAPEDVERIAAQIRQAKLSGERPDDEPVEDVVGAGGTPPAGPLDASAVVVSVPAGTVPVVLDVDIPGQGKRRVTVHVSVPEDRWTALKAGTQLNVRVDPDDPTGVTVEWDGAPGA